MIAMSNRRHDTQSEREHWLAHFEKQRSTATSFCREHGLCYQIFLRWRALLEPVPKPADFKGACFLAVLLNTLSARRLLWFNGTFP